jgi:hypothetical protein
MDDMWEYKIHCFEFVFMRMGELMYSIPNNDPRTVAKEIEVAPWLNEMGSEGWELIFMDSNMKKYIFKRKLTAKEVKKKTGVSKTSMTKEVSSCNKKEQTKLNK